jgi:preprotein translocase subunit SecA
LEIVENINALRPSFAALQEHELRVVSGKLKSRYDAGSSLDELLPEAYALVREATYRKLGKAHYDVQLMGAVVLHRGSIAEMATGEGKSLTGILPAYLYALSGDTVFMVTVNDYLAKRDAQLFHSVLELLGIEVRTTHIRGSQVPSNYIILQHDCADFGSSGNMVGGSSHHLLA